MFIAFFYQNKVRLRVAPSFSIREGSRINGEKLASIQYIHSDFLGHTLCEALCNITCLGPYDLTVRKR